MEGDYVTHPMQYVLQQKTGWCSVTDVKQCRPLSVSIAIFLLQIHKD